MALVGKLQDFSLLQLLNLINQGHKTGRLTVQDGGPSQGRTARLFFQEGRISFGALSGQADVLREGLLRSGKISQGLDKHVFSSYRPVTEKGLALLLEESGIISRDEVVAQEVTRLSELIDLLLSWDSGTFKFEPGVLPPPGNVGVSLGLEGIIMEGAKRIEDVKAIDQAVPDLDATVQLAKQLGDKVRRVSLGTDDWRVIAAIDGKATIREIAKANGLDDFKVRKLICFLLNAGLIELAKGFQSNDELQDASKGSDLSGVSPNSKKSAVLRLVDRIRRI